VLFISTSNKAYYYYYYYNKVLIKVTLNKVIAGALYIVICGWNAVKVQGWQLTCTMLTVSAAEKAICSENGEKSFTLEYFLRNVAWIKI